MSQKTIDSIFKRKAAAISIFSPSEPAKIASASNVQTAINGARPLKSPRVEFTKINVANLERDPAKRQQIWEYHVGQRDKVRRGYLQLGPYQYLKESYPLSEGNRPRRFLASWFTMHSSWQEYSPTNDSVYCLPCFLFGQHPTGRPGCTAFIVKGFQNWKKVTGKKCAFMKHMGDDASSAHNIAVGRCADLMNLSRHIDKVMHTQTSEQILKNQLRVSVSIDAMKWMTFQGCAYRGHDESMESENRGIFLEMVKLLASYSPAVAKVVLDNAPKNCQYTSITIQKEILHILSSKVRNYIREEIGDSKFCILVDEARDVSKREQMSLVLRYVTIDGFVTERFFHLIRMNDTTSQTLKKELLDVLLHHNFNVQNVRGQGYDGASNMRGEWNGLQALFLRECPYAYYVHCFAHRLQLALVKACGEVKRIHQFFTKLSLHVNVVGASCKRHTQLQAAQGAEIAHMIKIEELETGKGANQIGTLQRAGDTRWGSHFYSICSLLRMFGPTHSVLEDISEFGNQANHRGDADAALDFMLSYEFIFILHLMHTILAATDMLSQALQQKSQDIVNAMSLVSTTKTLIQNERDHGWSKQLQDVNTFCQRMEIELPLMNARYGLGRGGRIRPGADDITNEHHYQVDIFNAALDYQLQELNNRFSEQSVELLILSSALDPKDAFKSFDIDKICSLAEKFYPMEFTEHERTLLRYQLVTYEIEVMHHPHFLNISSMSALCRGLVETNKSVNFYLVDRLIRLVLTLPVSTATNERSFSAMKIVKTTLRNKMDDGFLADTLVCKIEREIAKTFDSDSIIKDFESTSHRRAQFSFAPP